MPNTNRNRGFGFEREVVNRAREFGLEAERAWGSDGRAFGEKEDVDLKIDGSKFQAKRKKKLAAFLKPPDSCDGAVFREGRGKTYVMVELDTHLKLLAQIRALTQRLNQHEGTTEPTTERAGDTSGGEREPLPDLRGADDA